MIRLGDRMTIGVGDLQGEVVAVRLSSFDVELSDRMIVRIHHGTARAKLVRKIGAVEGQE